ncbi:uncharacterized protein LOC121385220 [Gigantopelta aegis]|uniref:uncharacterized protein LOC121385220 n=1 Tax=Gigantopelta aegis TaxID=1735272 RepID=UPI001B88B113|nr:uncharacterized protein LOC121385220 [Gigantopelta aegis]
MQNTSSSSTPYGMITGPACFDNQWTRIKQEYNPHFDANMQDTSSSGTPYGMIDGSARFDNRWTCIKQENNSLPFDSNIQGASGSSSVHGIATGPVCVDNQWTRIKQEYNPHFERNLQNASSSGTPHGMITGPFCLDNSRLKTEALQPDNSFSLKRSYDTAVSDYYQYRNTVRVEHKDSNKLGMPLSWTGNNSFERYDGSDMGMLPSRTGNNGLERCCDGSDNGMLSSRTGNNSLKRCYDGSDIGMLSSWRGNNSLERYNGSDMGMLSPRMGNNSLERCYYDGSAMGMLSSRTGNNSLERCYYDGDIKKKCYTMENAFKSDEDYTRVSEGYARNSFGQISNHIPTSFVPAKYHHGSAVNQNEKYFYSHNAEIGQGSISWNNPMALQGPFIHHTKYPNSYDADRHTSFFPTISETSPNPNYSNYMHNGPEGSSGSHLIARNPEPFSSTFKTCAATSDRHSTENRCHSSGQGIYKFQCSPNEAGLIANQYILIEKWQCERLREITLPSKVAHVYNPLEYAFETHYDFISKFCNSEKHILFLGMNPGPWGMSQNGVPFGEINIVKNWFGVTGSVSKPHNEHPKRPILGLDCKRSEVSGSRFWGFFKDICKTPENFFRTCFVYNLCPMAFMTESAKNITPPQLTANTLLQVNSVCDEALLRVVQLLNVKVIVGVGKYAYNRALKVMTSAGINSVAVDQIMHPSPINPAANKGWSGIVLQQLQEKGLLAVITQDGEIKLE